MINIAILQALFPNLKLPMRQIYAALFNRYCPEYEINSTIRMAAFLAQVGHESGSLRWLAELWGPTPAQKRYEPPSQLAKDLGNNQPGDGLRFKGRGLIQITGRANYQRMSELLRVDLISRPQLLETPDYAVRSACAWWHMRKLNDIADVNTPQAFERITRVINGGLNGLDDRVRRWNHAKVVLERQK